jgi:DNA invertase Pin-like site-specific DNA recombinase
MKIGYARVSTKDQNLALQYDALRQEGCEHIFQEKLSGSKKERPELAKLLTTIQANDIVIIWKLDRLGRSLTDLIEIVNTIHAKRVGLKSLNDPIDTTTAQGRLIFNLFASLAEFEREVIRERTIAGLKAARARGRHGGRQKGISKDSLSKAIIAQSMYTKGVLSVPEIIKQLNISKSSFYRYIKYGVENKADAGSS